MSLFMLGRQAAARSSLAVGFREDGAVGLALGTEISFASPRVIHYHPRKGADADKEIQELVRVYPGVPIHGLSPGWLKLNGRVVPPGLDSFCLYTGPLQGSDQASAGWEECLSLDLPMVAALIYAGPEGLQQRLERLAGCPRLAAVVCLPQSPGDLVVTSHTTDGTLDVETLSKARLALPERVHVRASWGALGWKLAQSTLCFGVDELAGWGLEEYLAYGGRARPASEVPAEEVRLGIREAGREPVEVSRCDWAS